MAHKRPWYQRNGSAMVMGTLHMPSAEHKWAYSAIIDMLNDRDAPIPDDPGFICGFTGLSKRKWREVRDFLLNDLDPQGEPRLQINGHGYLTNPRFERELAARHGRHREAVEYGREGGKKSAELRARGQTELDLDGEQESPKKSGKTAEKPRHKVEKNARFSAENPEKINGHAPENNGLAEPPPQATRARERASEAKRQREEEEDSSSTANPRNPARDSADDDERKEVFDLLQTMHRLAELGGVAIINPTKIAANVDVVKAWLAQGFDLEQTIVPAIKAQFADTRETSIGGLNFYSGRIAKLHAQRTANGTKPVAVQEPVFRIEGEDPRMEAVRHDLHDALGPFAYCTFLNRLRLEPVPPDEMGDDVRRPVNLKGDYNLTRNCLDKGGKARITNVLRKHGFTDLWT